MKKLIILAILLIVGCGDNSTESKDVPGCTLDSACKYNPIATIFDISCLFDDYAGVCGGPGGVWLWGECYSIKFTEDLYLSNNNLSGEIPPHIGSLNNLEKLYLWGNQLTG